MILLPGIAELLRRAEARLQGKTDSPRADAEFLLAHVLGISRSHLRVSTSSTLSEFHHRAFERLVQRRSEGEPVAYLTSSRGFWNLELRVSPSVLIPRPETELLVEWALHLVDTLYPDKRRSALQIADLGTGSGAIVLSLASELPAAFLLATDRSDAALAVARQNAQRAGVRNLRFEHGSWFEALNIPLRERDGTAGARFDLMISNPPYIAAGDPHLPALRYEPQEALVSGADGLDDLRVIVGGARPHLARGGWLMVEHGWDQGPAVRELFEAAGFAQVQTRRDLSGHERATAGQNP